MDESDLRKNIDDRFVFNHEVEMDRLRQNRMLGSEWNDLCFCHCYSPSSFVFAEASADAGAGALAASACFWGCSSAGASAGAAASASFAAFSFAAFAAFAALAFAIFAAFLASSELLRRDDAHRSFNTFSKAVERTSKSIRLPTMFTPKRS